LNVAIVPIGGHYREAAAEAADLCPSAAARSRANYPSSTFDLLIRIKPISPRPRVCFLVPNVESATKVVDELLLGRIDAPHSRDRHTR
jgi:hypothetical protein